MKEIVEKIAKVLYSKKAHDIVALDVANQTVITDYMVIATGRSAIQVRTLADEVEEEMSKLGYEPLRKEGQNDGRWAVLDYGFVLVHVFHTEDRDFYRLDKLWENEDNRVALSFDVNED